MSERLSEKISAGTPVWHVALVLLLGLLVYSNSLGGPFVFDDISNIQNNPVLRDLGLFTDLDAMSAAAGHADAIQHAVRTRYVSYLSFALNYRLHGLEPFGYHLVNLLIHLGNALLVYLLTGQLLRRVRRDQVGDTRPEKSYDHWAALVAALLFVSHPLQTQAVSYIVQRMTSLTALFMLLALTLYLKALSSDRNGLKRGLFGLALGAGLVGVLCKEFAAFLPLFLLGIETLNAGEAWTAKCKRLLLFVPVSLLLPVMLFGFGRSGEAMGEAVGDITAGPALGAFDYLLTQLKVVPQYLRMLVWPSGQTIDHDVVPAHSFFEAGVWSGAALLMILLSLLVWLTLRSQQGSVSRLAAMAGWGAVVALLPESSLFPIADVMFEHRMYFPLVWIALMIGVLLVSVAARLPQGRRCGLAVMVGLLILALAGTSWERNRVWSDRELLWRDAVAKSPQKARPHNNLAKVLEQQGRYGEALQSYAQAVALAPGQARIRFNYARTLHRTGDALASMKAYRETLRLDPQMAAAHFNLAHLALGLRDLGTAEQSLRAFLALPTVADAGETSRRREANHLLGNLLRDQRRSPEADPYYRAALQEATEPAVIQNDYAMALAERGRFAEAERFFTRAVTSASCYSEAYNNLGALRMATGRLDEAQQAFRQALRCDPNNHQARTNLARLEALNP